MIQKGRLIILLLLSFILTSCSSEVNREIVTNSKVFTEEEINQGMDFLEKEYKDYLPDGSKLKSLRYTDEESAFILDWYDEILKKEYQSIGKENCLGIISSFKTGPESGALESMTTYEGYHWVIAKKDGKWLYIETPGYLN